MKKKTIKIKSGPFQQEITLTVDEKLDSLNPKDFAHKKLEAANKALPKMGNLIRK